MLPVLRFLVICSLSLFFISESLTAEEISSETIIRHGLKVVIHPKEHSFVAEDAVTVPARLWPEFRFALHKGLNPVSATRDVQIVKDSGSGGSGNSDNYRVRLPRGVKTFILKYGGVINHPIEQYGREQARGISSTEGIISGEGVYLAGSSFWYPVFVNEMIAFDLNLELPSGWDAVSQGERMEHTKDERATHVRWRSPEPQEEIYIVAGRFHEYDRPAGKISAMVFLRAPDKGLAEKYLEATARYISMYDKLIGPYPYKKFALIENFWETGFGMPSFTLLGPKVIRFPFIIDTSYPHEILHNWWGNSVFPDYKKGNWSEGLTAYLSDHLLKEQKGEGVEYRRTTLQKYTDYVISGRDFPLTEFRSRHSSSSEAIGYGKSLMFFHMLRLELGDEVFIKGLRDFYSENKFKHASFDDIRHSFERFSGKVLSEEFDQWITKPGAPVLSIKDVKAPKNGSHYILEGIIEQKQQRPIYRLRMPIAITLEGKKEAYETVIAMNKERVEIQLDLPSRPLRIDLDPAFDVFRRLSRDEIPPAISQVLGAAKLLVILPSSAGGPILQAYREFADFLKNSGSDEVITILDTEIKVLPSDRAVAVIGRENRYFDKILSALSPYGTTINEKSIRIGDVETPLKNHSLVLTARNSENKDVAMMFIYSALPNALPGLARKLPHYNKYSYLIFEGHEPANVGKGQWPVLDSSMTVYIPDANDRVSKVEMEKLKPRKPLIEHQSISSAEKMMETIRFLSGDELKGRGLGTDEIDRAAGYIAKKFQEAGLQPAGDGEGSFLQEWKERVRSDSGPEVLMKNVVGVVPGKKSDWSAQSVIIGAHYDHLGSDKGQIYHGADDNASGVSVLIELAVKLGKNLDPDRNLIFAAFTGEEAGKIGSKHFINSEKRYPIKQCIGMINLDTVGRLGKNKLLVLGAGSAKEWAHIFKGAGRIASVDVETVSEELDSSDQKSFQEAGVPAVQLFTGPHPDYHRPTDTIEKINPEGLVKVTSVATKVIEYLASRQEPLTATISSGENFEPAPRKERKVGLGIIPDFTFAGNGCRLSGVIENSPAEKAGLKEGDIIIRINSAAIDKLKDLSDILKSLDAGTKVRVVFLRGGEEQSVEAELTAR